MKQNIKQTRPQNSTDFTHQTPKVLGVKYAPGSYRKLFNNILLGPFQTLICKLPYQELIALKHLMHH